MLIAIREAGIWPAFEDWKRGTVEILVEQAAKRGVDAYPLWDFTDFNTVTTEKIPDLSDTETVMQWFWEPSHFKKAAGDLVFNRVLDHESGSNPVPTDFGVKLSSHNIEDALAPIRNDGRVYDKTAAKEVAIIRSRVDDMLRQSEGTGCGRATQLLYAASKRGAHREATASHLVAEARTIYATDKRRHANLDVPFREAGFKWAVARFESGHPVEPPPSSWQAYQERGRKRASAMDYAGAEEDYSKAIVLGPKTNPALYFLRGSTRLHLEDFERAIEDFEMGLTIDPTNKSLLKLLKGARKAMASQR